MAGQEAEVKGVPEGRVKGFIMGSREQGIKEVVIDWWRQRGKCVKT